MPAPPEGLARKYDAELKDRVEKFSGIKRRWILREDDEDEDDQARDIAVPRVDKKSLPSWRHELYHDAESAFWLLV